MNNLKKILGKSNETLTEHISRVYNVWQTLKERYFSDINNNDFWNDSMVSIIFHDFGKISNNFQDKITGRVNNYDNYIRHEFISGMYLFVCNYNYYQRNPVSLFAVFSHHKMLTKDLFRNETTRTLDFPVDAAEEFIEWTKPIIPQNQFQNLSNKNSLKYISVNKTKNLFYDYERRIVPLLNNLQQKNRIDYINHKAVLQISDWLASGHKQLPDQLSFDIEFLKQKILEKINSERKKQGVFKISNISLKEFQEKSNTRQDVIAIAPTGSGKTEAALIWASNKNKFDKIIYLLPTKVTSNAIYQRLKDYFGESNTAIIHSSAFFFRKEISDDYERKDYLLDKTFFANVNVCTIDQALTQGFNLGYWELKTFHMRNARIIIDEIHLYEPYTLGLIIATISYLKENFNSSFYIMTATMPKALKQLLQKYLDNPLLIEDKELLQQSRNKFHIKEKFIKETIKEIIDYAKGNKKVLVVVNTVDEAISLFKTIKSKIDEKKINILCYHSRFILKHRKEKEDKIFELEKSAQPGILIATQVVEVSLDIDFDVLFTENAPIDAIIQRAGRVNRKRRKSNTKIFICKHSEISEKWVYKSNNILNNTWEVLKNNDGRKLTEQQLTNLVDEVYEGIHIESDSEFLKGINIYKNEQEKLRYIYDNLASDKTMTRLNMDTISVIPYKNYTTDEMYKITLVDKQPFEIAKHELSVRKSKEYKFRIDTINGYKFIDAHYNEETGMDFNVKENESVFL